MARHLSGPPREIVACPLAFKVGDAVQTITGHRGVVSRVRGKFLATGEAVDGDAEYRLRFRLDSGAVVAGWFDERDLRLPAVL